MLAAKQKALRLSLPVLGVPPMQTAQHAKHRSQAWLVLFAESYLHLLVMVDVQKALPELDNLQGHKQGNWHQVRVQNPKRDHQNDPIHKPILVVALQEPTRRT